MVWGRSARGQPGQCAAVSMSDGVAWWLLLAAGLWLMSRRLAARGCRGAVAGLRVRVGVWGRWACGGGVAGRTANHGNRVDIRRLIRDD